MSTTPLPKLPARNNLVKSVETNNLSEHYALNINGLYGDRQYTDLSLILRAKHRNP